MEYTDKQAEISDDQLYRFLLTREWDSNKGKVMWIMLNPSTADAMNDDPTIKKCVSYADKWGYGSIAVVNTNPFRSPNPKEMRGHSLPVDVWVQNHAVIERESANADMIVAGWGNDAEFEALKFFVNRFGNRLFALQVNNTAHPAHPLYLNGSLEPRPYRDLLLENAKKLGKIQ